MLQLHSFEKSFLLLKNIRSSLGRMNVLPLHGFMNVTVVQNILFRPTYHTTVLLESTCKM